MGRALLTPSVAGAGSGTGSTRRRQAATDHLECIKGAGPRLRWPLDPNYVPDGVRDRQADRQTDRQVHIKYIKAYVDNS